MGSKAIYFGYRILGAFLFPVVLLYFLTRVARNPRYWATLRQRLGILPLEYQQTDAGSIWFHAVSVGEILAILPLVRSVGKALPSVPIFVSSTTLAGFGAAREKFTPGIAGVFFAPIDYPFAVRRVLRRLRPSVVVVAETEIWPNLFREVRRAGAGLIVVNGRISDSALSRYIRWRWFFSAALQHVSVILAQSARMQARFLEVGAPPSRTEVGGNLKYDLEPASSPPPEFVSQFFSAAKVWIAASTSEDGTLREEDAVLASFAKVTGWKLLLAPRHPERFAEVAAKLTRAGARWVRRTELRHDSQGDVLLLDTVGELAGLFSLADAVFMGGTLADRGGHNVLEPALYGKTITVGPHLENFPDIAEQFRAAHAFHEIRGAAELEPFVDTEMGARAHACAQQNRGAAELAVGQVANLHRQALPCPMPPLLTRALLSPLAYAWKKGGANRRARLLRSRQTLASPVISIGNITAGGTGKTPAVLHLARWLAAKGYSPGVLTRGHGRASPHGVLTVPKQGNVSRSHTGDEPQLLLRSGIVALGVASDRAKAGRQLEQLGWADIFLLDDGFQHASLARDFDLVLIDGLAPFGNFQLIPLGRLREPLHELARASAFLITRVDRNTPAPAIVSHLKRLNPAAPVFRSRVVPQEWVSLDGSQRFPPNALPFRKVLAFCGLGNPRSFWKTLSSLGIEPVDCLEYDDHHLYTPRESTRFGQLGRALGVEALLTTEKDAVNLCELTAESIRPLQLFWLRIGIEIEEEDRLFELIEASVSRRHAHFARQEGI